MALQFVGWAAAGDATGAAPVANLTALSGGISGAVASGDLVIVEWDITGVSPLGDLTMTLGSAGYTALFDLISSDTVRTNMGGAYKLMTGTPDTNVTGQASGNSIYPSTIVASVWRGVDTASPLDVAAVSATSYNSANADCPAITPITANAVVLALGAGGGTLNAGSIGAPTGYGNLAHIEKDGSGTVCSYNGIASKVWSGSGAENPGAYTNMQGGAQGSWCGITIALRPALLTTINMTVGAVTAAGINATLGALWVLPSDVRSGVQYGPNGNDFTGTYAGGGGGLASRVIGSSVIRRLH